jgi:dTDP-4-amino-4,6-dideoxygalactose transaminase
MEAANFRGHESKYMNPRIGMNSRLDTIQAAILLEKLAIFADEIEARERVARRYNTLLEGHVAQVPHVKEGYQSVWAQYTVEVEDRSAVQAKLKDAGIPSAVYYPIPMHHQGPYKRFPTGPGGLPVTDRLKDRVMSLPMHPYLEEGVQDQVVAGVKAAVA